MFICFGNRVVRSLPNDIELAATSRWLQQAIIRSTMLKPTFGYSCKSKPVVEVNLRGASKHMDGAYRSAAMDFAGLLSHT